MFTNDQNGREVKAQIPITYSNSRYDLFTLEEGVNITFPIKGDYEYSVYQMPNNTSLNPDDGLLLEIGTLEFEDDSVELPSVEMNNEIVVYGEEYTS